jgi:hypothetical protein
MTWGYVPHEGYPKWRSTGRRGPIAPRDRDAVAAACSCGWQSSSVHEITVAPPAVEADVAEHEQERAERRREAELRAHADWQSEHLRPLLGFAAEQDPI